MFRPALYAALVVGGGLAIFRFLPDAPGGACPPKGGQIDATGAVTFDSTDVDQDAVVSSEIPPFHPPVRSGRVIARFVIDSTGLPDLATLSIEPSPYAPLAKAVRAYIPQTRFLPAKLDGCRVRVWARWPFVVQGGMGVQT